LGEEGETAAGFARRFGRGGGIELHGMGFSGVGWAPT
jgi:hypothetical protein